MATIRPITIEDLSRLTQYDLDRINNSIVTSWKCWRWVGAIRTDNGYGVFTFKKRIFLAHRLVYSIIVGEIPNGLQLDHTCRNHWCVNPTHLEPVTLKENVLRGAGISAQNARKTHCHKGHPLFGENLRISKKQRHCRTCDNQRKREKRAQGLWTNRKSRANVST